MSELYDIKIEQVDEEYEGSEIESYEELLVTEVNGQTMSVPIGGVQLSDPHIFGEKSFSPQRPEVVDFDRVFVFEGNLHAEKRLVDGSVLELSVGNFVVEAETKKYDEDGRHPDWSFTHFTYPTLNNEKETVWQRPGSDHREIETLVSQGLSPAETLDFWMVEMNDVYNISEWAKERGVSHQAISENVSKAVAHLQDEEYERVDPDIDL